MPKRIYCALPWYTMQFHPDGSYGCCCHICFSAIRVPSSIEELMTYWNSHNMMRLRANLLEGKVKKTPCERCYDRFFSTDHDIFGMLEYLPKYSKRNNSEFEVYYEKANEMYKKGFTKLDIPPLELYIFTSQLCNLRCIMCLQNRYFLQFPTQNIKSLVEELGWEKIDRFGYVGGETFFAKDALDLLEFAASQDTKGACIYITTNGLLVDKYIDKLDKIDNLLLTISIDGIGQVYEKIRVNANWSHLLGNLMLLKRHKKLHPNWRLNIHSLVMNSTYPCLTDLIKLAEQVEATIFFAPINSGHPQEDIFFNPFILKDPLIFEKTVDKAIAYATKVDSFKGRNSLEKIRLYMDTRRKCFKYTLLKIIMRTLAIISDNMELGHTYINLRTKMKIPRFIRFK
jgi:sulfatase maturation enzyme AslB (radical SAM superfamily)